MSDFWALVGAPFVLLLVGLLVEYWVIQPIRNSQEYKDVSKENRRDWATATTRAIKRFRRQQPHYKGLFRRKNIKIEATEVKRGYAIIWIAVSKSQFFRNRSDNTSEVEERFELTIDRTGDILRVKSLDVVGIADKSNGLEAPASVRKNKPKHHPNPYAVYLYVIIGLLSGTGAFTSSGLIYYLATPDPYLGDIFFWGLSLTSMLCGIALAIGVDIHFQMDQAYAWQRLPLSVILGIVGGPLGILVSCVGVVILVVMIGILSDYQGLNGNNSNRVS